MDSNGARHLRKRLESHEHWQQAEAVRTGEQPMADPDASELVELAPGERRYRDGTRKRLVEGRWVITVETEEPALDKFNAS
jgi:hypothetical protein